MKDEPIRASLEKILTKIVGGKIEVEGIPIYGSSGRGSCILTHKKQQIKTFSNYNQIVSLEIIKEDIILTFTGATGPLIGKTESELIKNKIDYNKYLR